MQLPPLPKPVFIVAATAGLQGWVATWLRSTRRRVPSLSTLEELLK